MRSIYALLFVVATVACTEAPPEPESLVGEGGPIVIEAESFDRQTHTDVRRWYVTSATVGAPADLRDLDPSHAAAASGGAYLEILPDTRATPEEELVVGENFINEPGRMAVLEYDLEFDAAGRYYVWVSIYSTGPDDNGIHVGLDGEWPDSGQRMQWCEGKDAWTWASRQRTEEEHCGVPGLIYLDVATPGPRVVQFSMREDGFEFDRFALTIDAEFDPAALKE
ncbi:MAG: hypothetical protein O3A53_05860 [Acidobacteria bacterium]|nr:hypothetical protein [Acidobacteriota bacterium]MDA1234306.1 hypothetical protein [Acidobacteriota bacterium]